MCSPLPFLFSSIAAILPPIVSPFFVSTTMLFVINAAFYSLPLIPYTFTYTYTQWHATQNVHSLLSIPSL